MAQSLTKIYLHIVFSTKYRKPMIEKEVRTSLFKYLAGICNQMECVPVQIGGYYDHVHILCLLSKKVTVMKLLEELKKSSSKWMKQQDSKYSNFYWQNGYGAFSVNPYEVDKVINYIANQEEHHKKKNFQNEFRAFLKKYKVEYKEEYVWD